MEVAVAVACFYCQLPGVLAKTAKRYSSIGRSRAGRVLL